MSFGGPNYEKSFQNHEKVRSGESQKLLGGVLGPFWPPRVPQGRKVCKQGIVQPPPQDPFGVPNLYFSDLLGVYFPLIFGLAFGKAPGSIFHGFWTIFSWFCGSFFPCFGSAPTGGKCRLDTLLIRFEAHRRFGK